MEFVALACCLVASVAHAESTTSIGMQSFVVTDSHCADSVKTALKREWMVDVYYAARAGTGAAKPYFDDDALLRKLTDDKYYGQKPDALQHWASRSSDARKDAAQKDGERDPLLTILPGMGVARANYALTGAFVQHGFVVAVIDLPYLGIQRLPDGRILRADDDPLAQSDNYQDYAPRIRDFVRDVGVSRTIQK